jgi:hypothetical protein
MVQKNNFKKNLWTFQESMAELGCTIRTFDPTIEADTKLFIKVKILLK